MAVEVVTLAERPELEDAIWGLTELWPSFLLEDPIADLYYDRLDRYAEHVLVALEGDDVIARAFAVPFAQREVSGAGLLPSGGWDTVVRWAWLDSLTDRPATHVSALEITVAPHYRGTGLAERLLAGLKASARARGVSGFVAPVRPSRKSLEPLTPMDVYAHRTRVDGLPADPWLRLHVREGGRIHGVCPHSMVIAGTLDDWRGWTALPFDRSGPVEVPGALVPVHVDVDQDHAVYVEPNVWVVHDL